MAKTPDSKPPRPAPANGDLKPRKSNDPIEDPIDESIDESFPASDPPSHTPTTGSTVNPDDATSPEP